MPRQYLLTGGITSPESRGNVLSEKQRKLVSWERSGSQSKRSDAKNQAEPDSLGIKPYLADAYGTFENSAVCDIKKNPHHQWEHKFPRKRDGVRGRIVGFSRKSRMRMMKRMAECDKDEDGLFISLTTPWEIPPAEMKDLLWAFCKRLERKFPRFSCIWKLEPHKKGDWHFHLMCYGIRYLPHQVAKAMWAAILKTSGIKGAYHRGVDVEWCPASNKKKIQNYLMKYMAKEFEGGDYGVACGRVWGVRGGLPRLERKSVGMTNRQLVWLWRIISRKQNRNVVKLPPVFFTDDPEHWLDVARELASMNTS